MNNLILNADIEKGVIDRHIYGHFAEHLGNCIYGGFWVEFNRRASGDLEQHEL